MEKPIEDAIKKVNEAIDDATKNLTTEEYIETLETIREELAIKIDAAKC